MKYVGVWHFKLARGMSNVVMLFVVDPHGSSWKRFGHLANQDITRFAAFQTTSAETCNRCATLNEIKDLNRVGLAAEANDHNIQGIGAM